MALQQQRRGGALRRLLRRARSVFRDLEPDPEEQRRRLGVLQEVFAERYERVARDLARGNIDTDEFFNRMSASIRQLHIQAAIAGVGDVSRLDRNAEAVIREQITNQTRFLRNWWAHLRTDGVTPEMEAQLTARAKLYAGASNETFSQTHLASRGMPRLPFYPARQTQCKTNCKCEWDPRKLPGEGNWDVTWKLNPADHCDTCRARARAANPLEIRNGEIVDEGRYSGGALFD